MCVWARWVFVYVHNDCWEEHYFLVRHDVEYVNYARNVLFLFCFEWSAKQGNGKCPHSKKVAFVRCNWEKNGDTCLNVAHYNGVFNIFSILWEFTWTWLARVRACLRVCMCNRRAFVIKFECVCVWHHREMHIEGFVSCELTAVGSTIVNFVFLCYWTKQGRHKRRSNNYDRCTNAVRVPVAVCPLYESFEVDIFIIIMTSAVMTLIACNSSLLERNVHF